MQEGDIVYLEKKKKKADKPNYDHVVQVGESMHSIAQMYGIQIKSLYKMNKKDKDYIPEAADIHEQISLASKEASGTSNMKFMLNGAVAIGTMDGANVEMHQFVGDDNIYIFGESSEQVIEHYAKADYVSRSYYDNDENIKRAIDFIVSDEMMAVGCRENLERLYNELLNKDWFMTLPDFEEYVAAKERIFADYEDRMAWAKKMLVNMSQAGFFSSDRTIAQYNEDIWHL